MRRAPAARPRRSGRHGRRRTGGDPDGRAVRPLPVHGRPAPTGRRRAGGRPAGLVGDGGAGPRGRAPARRTLGDAGSRCSLGAAALTAWDLFLDPQMVGEGYWCGRRGLYRGIPLTNFAGWFVTGVGRDGDPRTACRRRPAGPARPRRRLGRPVHVHGGDGDGRVRSLLPRPGRRRGRRLGMLPARRRRPSSRPSGADRAAPVDAHVNPAWLKWRVVVVGGGVGGLGRVAIGCALGTT